MKQKIDGKLTFSGIGKPMNIVKKGNQVYFQEKQANNLSQVNTKKIGSYRQIVNNINSQTTEAAKLKLLRSYANTYGMSANDVKRLTKATGLPQFSSNDMEEFTKNACEVLFQKFLDQMDDDVTELNEQNWVDWKIKEFNKIIKNGIGNMDPVDVTLIRDDFEAGGALQAPEEFTFNGTSVDQLKKKNFVEIIHTLDTELNICLENYLQSIGSSQLGDFKTANLDGRRRSRRSRRSRKSPIRDGRKRSKKPSSKKMSLKKRSKKRSLKKPKFDGGGDVKKWLHSLVKKH